MREFAKSMMSYTWAMSVFGVQQTLNVLTPRQGRGEVHPATRAFSNVTGAAREEFGNTLEGVFRAGDNLQRGLVDATFSIFTLGLFNRGDGSRGCRTTDTTADTTAGAAQAASDLGRRTAASATQAASDFGRGTADAFQQSVRAARRTADEIGRAVGGRGGGWGRRDDPWPQDDAGAWDPVRPDTDTGR